MSLWADRDERVQWKWLLLFFKLPSQNHSLVCTAEILISFFPFLYALLAFNLMTVSFTRFLHLAVSSVERRLFCWPGPEGTVVTAMVPSMEAGFPLRSPPRHLRRLQASGHLSCWKQIHMYSANPLDSSQALRKCIGKPLAAVFAVQTAAESSETWLLQVSHMVLSGSQQNQNHQKGNLGSFLYLLSRWVILCYC